MITEQYVSFETAKLLKEAGFEEMVNSCFMYDDKADEYEYEFVNGYAIVKKALRDNYNGYENTISRPTQALAARWLREVYRISVDAAFMAPSTNIDVWQYFIGKMDDMIWPGDFETSERTYATYEEAMEAGLQEAIKLVKKQ